MGIDTLLKAYKDEVIKMNEILIFKNLLKNIDELSYDQIIKN
jgi:hypothetical protein